MSKPLQPNRPDHGAGKSPPAPKLSERGVFQFGKHKGKILSETPLGYLQWLSREGVLNDSSARRALDEELRRRKQEPQAEAIRELVAAMGGILFGNHEGQSIGDLSTFQLKGLLSTPNIRTKSKARIENQLKKRKKRSRKNKRSKR